MQTTFQYKRGRRTENNRTEERQREKLSSSQGSPCMDSHMPTGTSNHMLFHKIRFPEFTYQIRRSWRNGDEEKKSIKMQLFWFILYPKNILSQKCNTSYHSYNTSVYFSESHCPICFDFPLIIGMELKSVMLLKQCLEPRGKVSFPAQVKM